MTLSDYLKSQPRGAVLALAKAIGANAPDVSSWSSGRRSAPIIHCVAIERITDGAVTRKELRPDDWYLIWPELAAIDFDHFSCSGNPESIGAYDRFVCGASHGTGGPVVDRGFLES
ncbi:transcriptional regulator [Ralstonia solanacearum]|uniref:transcriptional regulator n=1 Tax=Ralstonia solanacearum TaxID=305 RepID=UPI0009BDF4F0|nr:YdaS family helix-turn-helix protein [Ralstonia solanacearum]